MADDDPNIGEALRNWRESDASFTDKLRMAARNNFIKLRTRKNCCGNYGEPGC